MTFGHPEYPIIMREESGLALDDAEWGVDPVYLMKDPKKYADRELQTSLF